MDDCGVSVVVIVSPKEEERVLFLQDISNECESSFLYIHITIMISALI